jgi:hypothetical protein
MKSIIFLLSMLLFFTNSLVAETEAKNISGFDYDAYFDFCGAREYEVLTAIKNFEKLSPKEKRNFKIMEYEVLNPPESPEYVYKLRNITIKGDKFWADFLIRYDKKILISHIHLDASVMHPEDQDKEKLLKRFGIDSNESADKLTFGDAYTTINFSFDGKTLKSVDIKTFID